MDRTVISNAGEAGLVPALLALDWGTSSLRAFLMDRSGNVIAQRASAHGIQNLPEQGVRGFEMAFAEMCGDWVGRWPGLPVVASGMVGSAQGWKEAPYVVCPADTDGLAGIQELAGNATGLFYMTEEGQEGRNAWLEKREPDFSKFRQRP